MKYTLDKYIKVNNKNNDQMKELLDFVAIVKNKLCYDVIRKIGFYIYQSQCYEYAKEVKIMNSVNFYNISKSKLTEEMCMLAIEKDADNINCIPELFLTEKMCMLAIETDAYYINDIPESKLTEEMCMLAIEKDSTIISCIPESKLTEEMCMLAIQKDTYNIKYIPDSFKTEEMCMLAFFKRC